MSYCVVLNVFSINFYEVAVSVDFVWNQGRIVRNDQQFASSCEVSVCVVEFVEGISFCIHFASDSFVVSCAEVEVHCFAFVHFNGEECFISEVKYCNAVAFFYFPETWFGSVVCPIEGNFTNVSVFVFTGNPNFVGLLCFVVVVSYVYVVFQSFRSCGLPLILESDLEVYSVWHDFLCIFVVGSVIGSCSFVQFSFLNQFSNASGFFDQVDGPVLVDVASVVTIFYNFTRVNWFACRIVSTIYTFQVNCYVSVSAIHSSCLFELINIGVTSCANIVSFTIFSNFSIFAIIFYFSWDVFNINFSKMDICCTFFCWQPTYEICCSIIVGTRYIPFVTILPESSLAELYINNVNFNACYSIQFIVAFVVNVIIFYLIISVQRHPDNIAWFEVYCFVIVEFCSGFFNQFAVFVCYKQGTIKLEVVWPISLFIGACAVGNSKSVSAHAKYHSRSHSYGKYFFHSLSSS